MEENKKRGYLFYYIILILTLIVMIIGATFTYYSLVASDKEDSTWVQTGDLAIKFVDGSVIKADNLMPMNEPTFNTKSSYYRKEFSVRSTGSLDQTIDIYINVNSNEFRDGNLRFSLYGPDDNKIGTGTITSGKVLVGSNIDLKSMETKKFTVLIWLQENNLNQDYEKGKSFSGRFDIEAQQIKY